MEQFGTRCEDNEKSSSEDEQIELELDESQTQEVVQRPALQGLASFLEVGEWVDFFNGNKWVSAEIQDIERHTVKIHSNYVPFSYQTIRKQWVYGVDLEEQLRVDVKNKYQGWMEGKVISVQKNKVLVHYSGYKRIYDEWVGQDEVAPIGMYSNATGIGRVLKQNPQQKNKLAHKFQLFKQIKAIFEKHYQMESSLAEQLSERGFEIKEMQSDGNCMFRAISDQLYGSEVFHRELRMFAMQYIQRHKDFFQDFILSGDIDKYVHHKSKDGVWGDNIELQAFRELYNIPIEIYMYGPDPIKTGLELNPRNQEPIRLSYHGNSHYNSVKPKVNLGKCLIEEKIGVREGEQLEKKKELVNEEARQYLLVANNLDEVFNESKKMIEEMIDKDVMKESMQTKEKEEDEEQLLDFAIKQSQKEESSHLDRQIMTGIMEESKKNQEMEQEKQLQKVLEESELEKAIKESQQISQQSFYQDPMSNPTIANVMQMGVFQIDHVIEAYLIYGDDPEMIVNYLYDKSY